MGQSLLEIILYILVFLLFLCLVVGVLDFRCNHTWEIKGVQRYTTKQFSVIDFEWHDGGMVTDVYYVCSTCKSDKSREVPGEFTPVQAKELFPRP